MSITYGVVEERYEIGGQEQISYGIAAYGEAEEDGPVTVIRSERNIASSKEALLSLVSDCNRLSLSPLHLSDVVEDFLA